MKELLISFCSGLIGVLLTIGYQHFLAPDPTFTFYINDKEVEVNQTDYIELINQKEVLQNELADLKKQYTELKVDSENSKNISEFDTIPVIECNDLSLSIDGENIPINKSNSMITIDGRDYFSREIIESLISDNQSFTIIDGTLYIGKIIMEKSSLTDEVIVDSANISKTSSIKDSYGNLHTDVLYPLNYHSYMIFNINRQFSFLKLKLAVQENGHSDAIVTIKADNSVVYTSPELSIITEPFEVIDIPIDYCSLLTIEINSGVDGGMGMGYDCIISDATVYN